MRVIVEITRTARFQKAWKSLNEEEKELARKALRNLAIDFRCPALRIKKIQGTERIWEVRVSLSLRITFEIKRNAIILRTIGRHDETLKRP
jgi:antitoxin MazE